jgi:hypothetical protein
MKTHEVRTDALRTGDRVVLPGGIVRTVAAVGPTAYANIRGELILVVQYREGPTPEWGEGNTALASSEWMVVAP